MLKNLVIICTGASFGAISRWGLSVLLNNLHPFVPVGTLVVNVIGSYLLGIFLGLVSLVPNLGPEWRLLIVTGFLGSLTTFSSFSGEVGILLQQQRYIWAMSLITMHVVGSLFALFLGIGSVRLIVYCGNFFIK